MKTPQSQQETENGSYKYNTVNDASTTLWIMQKNPTDDFAMHMTITFYNKM